MIISIAAIAFVALNLTGTWSGKLYVNGESSAFMVLSQDGDNISGTIGPDRDAQFKITKATVEGDTLTIEAQPGGVLRFVMKMEGEKLAGDVFEDGVMVGTIKFERVKE